MGIFDIFKSRHSKDKVLRVPPNKAGAIANLSFPLSDSYSAFNSSIDKLDVPSLISIVENMGMYSPSCVKTAWSELNKRAKSSAEAASIIEREWQQAEKQAAPLHFDRATWEWAKTQWENPANVVQSIYINQMINTSPTVKVSGINGTSVVMALPGAKELPFADREQGRVFRITGLAHEQRGDIVDIHTGFPLVCAKCGRPMARLLPLFGMRPLESSGHLTGLVLRGDNAKEIMRLLQQKRVIIALPTCGSCNVSASISFGYQFSKHPYVWENYFYTDDPQIAANLQSHGCSIQEVVIHESRESLPPSPTILRQHQEQTK